MTSSDLDLQLRRFRARREGPPKPLAGALLDAGRAAEALEVIHLSLLDGEPDPELLILEGRALYDQGDLREAQAALLRALKVNPQLKEGYRWLGQVLIERGDPTRAVQVFGRAVKLDPRDSGLAQSLARAQRLAHSTAARAPSSRPPPAARAKPSGRPATSRQRPEPSAGRGSQPPRTQPQATMRGRGQPDPLAEALLEEPTTDAGGSEPVSRSRASAPLPFDDDDEHEDDMVPTQAIDMREDLRRLRQSERPPIRADSLPPSVPRAPRAPVFEPPPATATEDDETDLTSIVPSPRELEQVEQERERERVENDEATIIGVPALLADPGKPEQPDQVLGMLKAQGVFEPANAPAAAQTWAEAQPGGGSSIVKTLAIGWGLALLAAVGGYFAFQLWISRNKQEAERLVQRAYVEAYDGQHNLLKAAETSIGEARQLDPRSQSALEALLFVQSVRVLEEGAQELAPLKQTLGRAAQLQNTSFIRRLAGALSEPADQARDRLPDLLNELRLPAEKDPRLSYAAGRLAQRLGSFDEARILLSQATASEARIGPAWIGLGELARMEGQIDRAVQHFERALGDDKRALRAELWLLILRGQPGQAAAQLGQLDALAKRVDEGSDPERFLADTLRGVLNLTLGKNEAAHDALKRAGALHIVDPELLAYFSEVALSVGEPLLAYRAAQAASKASGGAPRYQALLASTLLQQPDGGMSLVESSGLEDGHGALALARAEAALLTDLREALERAKKELGSYRATADGKDDAEASALQLRIDLRLGANVESLLPAARALAARAPDVVAAHFALAEALISSEQGQPGLDALAPALKLAPGAADTHYLLGRAQQLLGQAEEAQKSLQRALAIAPSHVEARLALGRNLLDVGAFDAALGILRGLEGRAGGQAVLGIIEALIGKRKYDDASAQIDKLAEPLKTAPPVLVLRARLAMKQNKPTTAVELLAPLVAEEAETRTSDTLTAYGDALLATDRAESAVAAYDAALELDASFGEALLGRARAALRTDKPDQALAWAVRAEAALALRPRPTEVQGSLLVTAARADIAKNQFASARDRLNRAIALPDPPTEAHFWLAEVLARSDMDAARKQYAKYLEISPNGTYVTRAQKALGQR